MNDQQIARLKEIVRELAERVKRYRGRALGEQNTKASLIEPMLAALSWSIQDPDEVYREFRPNPKDNPVDYCLRLLRNTRLLVEAKGLDEDLSDRRWIAQALGYATMAGAEWCVLTNGDEYRLYNAVAAVEADAKLFCRIKMSESPEDEAVRVLSLISRHNMEENLLNLLWNAHHVDRRVKEALRGLLDPVDKRLVRLIRARVSELSPKDIAESLRRLDIRIESPSAVAGLAVRPRAASPGKRVVRARPQKGRVDLGVALADVIAVGLLQPPLKLFRRYRGQRLEATLQPDGKVEYRGTNYDSCSQAASAARATITGRPMSTNGWVFWQFRGDEGQTLCLADARQQFLDAKSRGT